MRRPISRRAFLRNTSATAASVVAARALAAPATAPITTQPVGRLNVGFVGVAGKATGSIENLAKAGANVVALCDIDGHRLGKAAEKYPRAKTYADFPKMLEQRDVEAVCVTTPDHTHAPAALAALALGKPVYCEKPLTHNVREARLLTEAARKARVATQMGNQGHAAAGTRAQVEAVQSGAIGAVTEVHVWTNRPVWPQGIDRPTDTPPVPGHIAWDLWLGPAPERPYHPSYHPFKWRGFWDFGTGALGDMGCHLFDAPFWALDLRDPSWVEATATGATAESAPTSSVVTYHFPARGDRGAVKLVWYDGGELPPAELVDGRVLKGENADKDYRDGGVVYVGERGRLMAAYLKAPEMLGPDGKDFKQPDPSLPRSVGHYREWIDACVDGTPAGSNFDYAGPLTEAVLLGNVALRAGTRIEWDAKAMRVTNLPAADALITREYRKGWEI